MDKKTRQKNKEKQSFQWKKKIVQKLTLDNMVVEEYDSVQIAAKVNNICTSQINRACRGFNKDYICHGYKWRYIE